MIWPIKTYIKKNGEPTNLLNLMLSDNSSSIICTLFGVHWLNFNFEVDKVYYVKFPILKLVSSDDGIDPRLSLHPNGSFTKCHR